MTLQPRRPSSADKTMGRLMFTGRLLAVRLGELRDKKFDKKSHKAPTNRHTHWHTSTRYSVDMFNACTMTLHIQSVRVESYPSPSEQRWPLHPPLSTCQSRSSLEVWVSQLQWTHPLHLQTPTQLYTTSIHTDTNIYIHITKTHQTP